MAALSPKRPGSVIRTRVLIGDDHALYLEALATVVDGAPDLEVAGTVADGREALDMVRRLEPDVALLDVGMPVLGGPVVAQRAAEEGLRTRVLLLSVGAGDDAVFDALVVGGVGVLNKDATRADIHAAIRRVASGRHLLAAEARFTAAPRTLPLTEREWALLELLSGGMTAAAIGDHLRLSAAVVRRDLLTLHAKLEAREGTVALAEAVRLTLHG